MIKVETILILTFVIVVIGVILLFFAEQGKCIENKPKGYEVESWIGGFSRMTCYYESDSESNYDWCFIQIKHTKNHGDVIVGNSCVLGT